MPNYRKPEGVDSHNRRKGRTKGTIRSPVDKEPNHQDKVFDCEHSKTPGRSDGVELVAFQAVFRDSVLEITLSGLKPSKFT